jgi:GTP-binding protein
VRKKEKSEFLLTLADVSQIPDLFKGPSLQGRREPRIAMVGRSNVGKSTLINALLGGKLAQVSKQPGKTRSIHFYLWKDYGKIVADLPGYGYAHASKTERERWKTFIDMYFQTDENLERAVVLLDARYGPTEVDQEAIKFLSLENIPVTVVFAKTDALKTQSERALRKRDAAVAIKQLGIGIEKVFWVSSHDKMGLDKLSQDLGLKNKVEG